MNHQTSDCENAPTAIKYINDIAEDAESEFNNLVSFKTVNNIYLLIYIKKGQKSIISYDLINNKKINEIKNVHKMNISQLKYFYDKFENRDLIISISLEEIKLWNISNMECIYNFINTKKNVLIYTACFLTYCNSNYIINTIDEENAPMTIYDFKGNLIKNIYYSSQKLFIDTFHDKKLSKNFIIFATYKDIKSYDINKNEIFHIYSDYKSRYLYGESKHVNVLISNDENIVKLIFLNYESFIRIFDFYGGTLLNKINFQRNLKEIYLWNFQFLFISQKKYFLLFDLKNEEIIKEVNIDKENYKYKKNIFIKIWKLFNIAI